MVNLRLKMIREQRLGVCILLGFILFAEVILHKDIFKEGEIEFQELTLEWQNVQSDKNNYEPVQSNLKPFNPNSLSKEQWLELGFTERQAEVILKYKKKLGGSFTSKLQLKECFIITERKYKELEPFLLIDAHYAFKQTEDKKTINYKIKKFDPNILKSDDWISMGFTEKQAEVILKYKKTLGGNFVSKEQLKKCYVISENKYKELYPYIVINETVNRKVEHLADVTSPRHEIIKKDLNSTTYKELWPHVKDAYIINRILKFREALGGFVSVDQINEVYGISKEVSEKLVSYYKIDISKVEKIDLKLCTEEKLKKHVYFRKYKDVIVKARSEGKDPVTVLKQTDPAYELMIKYIK
ncbi:helix-hairpin-helix domain-containing protein [Apibacter raozihei]|uniref:helix-hairpin-helix domain-containing protein n=1 Tax=Apibacter raozihei TaxID=2500547 RepID=UPI000FE3AF34|nr:helix-hairpin-helix domain-containing protein [Apibacter raozihei]